MSDNALVKELGNGLRGPECPPVEIFLTEEWSALATRERQRIDRHVAACAACASERLLAAVFDECLDDARIEPLVKRVARHADTATGGAQRKPGKQTWFIPVTMAASVAALAIAVSSIFIRTAPDPALPDLDSMTTQTRGANLSLIEPVGDQPAPPAVFRWAGVADADSYRVTLHDVSERVVWRRDAASAELALAPAQIESQHPGVEYRWRVEALDPEGRPVAISAEGVYRISP